MVSVTSKLVQPVEKERGGLCRKGGEGFPACRKGEVWLCLVRVGRLSTFVLHLLQSRPRDSSKLGAWKPSSTALGTERGGGSGGHQVAAATTAADDTWATDGEGDALSPAGAEARTRHDLADGDGTSVPAVAERVDHVERVGARGQADRLGVLFVVAVRLGRVDPAIDVPRDLRAPTLGGERHVKVGAAFVLHLLQSRPLDFLKAKVRRSKFIVLDVAIDGRSLRSITRKHHYGRGCVGYD